MQRIMTSQSKAEVYLRTLIIITNANGAVLGQTVGPEAFNGGSARQR